MKPVQAIKADHLRLLAEPDDLRKLRRQAEEIRANRALAVRRLLDDHEKDLLRREIVAAGEKPVA